MEQRQYLIRSEILGKVSNVYLQVKCWSGNLICKCVCVNFHETAFVHYDQEPPPNNLKAVISINCNKIIETLSFEAITSTSLSLSLVLSVIGSKKPYPFKAFEGASNKKITITTRAH